MSRLVAVPVDVTLTEWKKLAKNTDAYVLATYLVSPDGRVAEYARCIDPSLLADMWDTPDQSRKPLREFFSEDMWYAYDRLYNKHHHVASQAKQKDERSELERKAFFAGASAGYSRALTGSDLMPSEKEADFRTWKRVSSRPGTTKKSGSEDSS